MGGFRGPIKAPSQMDFPSLTFYVPEVDSGPFMDHFMRRGVRGEVPGRLTGAIECFDNDQAKNIIFTLQFAGADITGITPEKSDAGSEEIKYVKIDLYTESMTFKYRG